MGAWRCAEAGKRHRLRGLVGLSAIRCLGPRLLGDRRQRASWLTAVPRAAADLGRRAELQSPSSHAPSCISAHRQPLTTPLLLSFCPHHPIPQWRLIHRVPKSFASTARPLLSPAPAEGWAKPMPPSSARGAPTSSSMISEALSRARVARQRYNHLFPSLVRALPPLTDPNSGGGCRRRPDQSRRRKGSGQLRQRRKW